jgi:putative transcriptional regulator
MTAMNVNLPTLMTATGQKSDGLRGQLLVATSELNGSVFERAVIYIVSHTQEGAMGVVVNKPMEKIFFKDIAASMGIEEVLAASRARDIIFRGGPVDDNRGFVLHSADYALPSTITVGEGIALSATADIVNDIARGVGPGRMNFCLGYAGWAPGQLEDELHGNSWLLVPGNAQLVFDTPAVGRYAAATRALGLNALNFSSDVVGMA